MFKGKIRRFFFLIIIKRKSYLVGIKKTKEKKTARQRDEIDSREIFSSSMSYGIIH
jgi:hypothetical protein